MAARYGTPPRRPTPTRTFVWHSPPGRNRRGLPTRPLLAASACSHHSNILVEAAELGKFLQNNAGDSVSRSGVRPAKQEFTIVTWNIWFASWDWRERLCATLAETLDHDPDVVCWQEVTQNVHSIMLHCDFWRQRYDPTEEQIPFSYDCSVWIRKGDRWTRNQCHGWYVHRRYSTIYRRGLYVDLRLPNDQTMRVMTTHLESGKEKADTRRAQLDVLSRKAADHTPTLLVGDMNIDPSYPENSALPGLDLWLAEHPDDPGFTEDTYVNEMRFWAHGGKQKRVQIRSHHAAEPHTQPSRGGREACGHGTLRMQWPVAVALGSLWSGGSTQSRMSCLVIRAECNSRKRAQCQEVKT